MKKVIHSHTLDTEEGIQLEPRKVVVSGTIPIDVAGMTKQEIEGLVKVINKYLDKIRE